MKRPPVTPPVEFDEDAITNASSNPHFSDILQVRLSRRRALLGGLSASAAFLMGGSLSGCAIDDGNDSSPAVTSATYPSQLGFTAVPKSLADAVSLASGYSARVLYALGDPIDNVTAAWSDAGTETGTSYETRAGDHHDGMVFFGMSDGGAWSAATSDRGMMCINHENITAVFLHAASTDLASPRAEDAALKEINAHGVSVIEVARNGSGVFEINRASTRNRRITPNTAIDLKGPVRGSRFTVTRYSSNGTATRGTINNCASGMTPWGTYLTCEENWAGYFKRAAGDDSLRTAAEVTLLKRYGINQGNAGGNKWTSVTPADSGSTVFSRWDASVTGADATADFRNEPNNFGYVVEIDPFNPSAAPRKRTALGRLGHENATVGKLESGKPVVLYTGDDARFEYIYKFVSDALWDPADATLGLAGGDKYLDSGTLYVARFNSDGSGEWLRLQHLANGLTEDNVTFPFTSQAAVMVATRLAADAVGATKMDRPEWISVNPRNGEVYCTLTNNSNRAQGLNPAVDAANPRNYTDLKGGVTTQKGNVNGHIIRWRETGDHANATAFSWDIYLFGAQADADPATVNISGLTADNDLSSPDGLFFDPRGLLWIQTDDGGYTDVTNCMMLAAVPGRVGDGGATTIGAQGTFVGAAPGANLRRFLVGPRQCEITGITMTPDGKAMFVNIQHPGEDTAAADLATPANYGSHWPHNLADATEIGSGGQRPRSATLVITRNDGGVIGL